jgi:V8-like Glu-specific endopeptidase
MAAGSAVRAQTLLPNEAAGGADPVKRVKVFRVFGEDDRRAIDATETLPFSAVGEVVASFNNGFEVRTGTGVLVSDRIVMTAGHVIHDGQLGRAGAVAFTPGQDGFARPFGQVSAVASFVPEPWVNNSDDYFDFGLIALAEPIGQQAGRFDVTARPPSYYPGRVHHMTGYATDLINGLMYDAEGTVTQVDSTLIEHEIDGGPGQSGGPIWFVNSAGRPEAVAVYTGDVDEFQGGRVTRTYGVGARITTDLCTAINDFIAEFDSQSGATCVDLGAGNGSPPLCGFGAAGAMLGSMLLLVVGRMMLIRERPR